MRRWVCPRCETGKLAPSKPRLDDTRRYCLPCSDKTGRLVKRACPTIEAKKEARQTAQAERAARVRAKQRTKRCAAQEAARERKRALWEARPGVDLRAETARIWKTVRRVAKAEGKELLLHAKYGMPPIELRAGRGAGEHGHASPANGAVVYVSPPASVRLLEGEILADVPQRQRVRRQIPVSAGSTPAVRTMARWWNFR